MSAEWKMDADEGGIGTVAEAGRSLFVFGKAAVARHLESYTDQHRSAFQRLFGERGLPEFLAYCPITDGRSTAVALIASFTLEEGERGEWERLIDAGRRALLAAPEHVPTGPHGGGGRDGHVDQWKSPESCSTSSTTICRP